MSIQETLGYESGTSDKEAAVEEMRAAKEASGDAEPAKSGVLGNLEGKAGQLTGCEGMVEEGEKRKS